MVRFGILGTARIARAFLGYPMDNAAFVAIASRDAEKAKAFAQEFNLPHYYGSYDELIADPGTDAVYMPLPLHLREEYVARCALAGKHVLVEKPSAFSVSSLERMLHVCSERNVLFMEGFMYRFLRIHNRAKEIVQSGEIGELINLVFSWCFNIAQRGRTGFRLEKAFGGGSLYDLGIYGADFIRFITGQTLDVLHAYVHRENPDGPDMFAHAACKAGRVFATMTCGFTADANYYMLCGDKGSIYAPVSLSGREVENFLHIHLLEGDERRVEQFPAENPYRWEAEYFARCIERHEEPFLGGANSMPNIRLIEQILQQAVPI